MTSLDTIAAIYLNDIFIDSSFNQFIEHLIDVTEKVKPGHNVIRVSFKSPVKYTKAKAWEYKKLTGHVLPPDCNPTLYNGECHQNFIRKAQYSYAWDWGPSFPTMGISGDAMIIVYEKSYVESFTWTTEFDGAEWIINLEITTIHTGTVENSYSVKIPELGFQKEFSLKLPGERRTSKALNKITIRLNDSEYQIERWWPNGIGSSKMYAIQVTLNNKQELQQKIGFRTVELVQDYIDPMRKSSGRNFYFRINDVPVFLKGSNWIPVSMFASNKINLEKMRFLLDSAAEVGMNALRVWGGGFYESNEFYQYASEKGILIWQDLMFACALYPSTDDFLKTVVIEVQQQVDRLKKFPSILIWAGNNENELAIRTHWWTAQNYSEAQQVADYLSLYENLKELVVGLDPTRPFQMSSPSNGIESERQGGVSTNPGDQRYGDIHFYNEFINLWMDSNYLTPRCATEYGVQSFPLKETMLKSIDESEWEYTSPSMFYRQHHPGGHATNLVMIFSHLPIPDECETKSLLELHRCKHLKSSKFMSRLAYFSQIHQAITLKVQTFHYRRFRNVTNSKYLGNTMCALYWQLNDVWAAPTWSSIDYEQQWKMAHYEARRFFKNLAVYTFIDSNYFDLQINIINDNPYPFNNMILEIKMFAWSNGFEPIYTTKKKIDNVRELSSINIDITSFPKLNQGDISNYLFVTNLYDGKANLMSSDSLLPDFLFEIDYRMLGNVEVMDLREIHKGKLYEIVLESSSLSPFTWINVNIDAKYWLSDNGFLMSNRTKTVQLNVWNSDIRIEKEHLSVCNLRNCYVD